LLMPCHRRKGDKYESQININPHLRKSHRHIHNPKFRSG
jgi:hypothetical protein